MVKLGEWFTCGEKSPLCLSHLPDEVVTSCSPNWDSRKDISCVDFAEEAGGLVSKATGLDIDPPVHKGRQQIRQPDS